MKSKIAAAVADIYNWLDSRLIERDDCEICGKCCDFKTFDHRLFVTTPELIYFAARTGPLKPMPAGICPYNVDGKCTVHKYRFAGCRIFSCRQEGRFQGELSEAAVERFKFICTKFDIPYRYTDLAAALNDPAVLST